jgi:hypothetical protein
VYADKIGWFTNVRIVAVTPCIPVDAAQSVGAHIITSEEELDVVEIELVWCPQSVQLEDLEQSFI